MELHIAMLPSWVELRRRKGVLNSGNHIRKQNHTVYPNKRMGELGQKFSKSAAKMGKEAFV